MDGAELARGVEVDRPVELRGVCPRQRLLESSAPLDLDRLGRERRGEARAETHPTRSHDDFLEMTSLPVDVGQHGVRPMVTRRTRDTEPLEHPRDRMAVQRHRHALSAEASEHAVDELAQQALGGRRGRRCCRCPSRGRLDPLVEPALGVALSASPHASHRSDRIERVEQRRHRALSTSDATSTKSIVGRTP